MAARAGARGFFDAGNLPTMTVKDELTAELRAAMKAGDKPRVAAVRQVETMLAQARSAPGFTGDVDDALYREVIKSYVKSIQKSRDEYLGYGERGAAHAEQLAAEIEFLERWLPRTLGEDETREAIEAAIAELGASEPRDAGRVIGSIMKSGRDDLDGRLVARLVKERLESG